MVGKQAYICFLELLAKLFTLSAIQCRHLGKTPEKSTLEVLKLAWY